MNRLKALIIGVLLLHISVTKGATREKRWIPERMSDSDYGSDTQTSSPGSQTDGFTTYGSQPNHFSFWSHYYPGGFSSGDDYGGMQFRGANQDSNHGMMDPVQQLQNVQAYSYAQNYQQMYPQAYSGYHGYPPYPLPPPPSPPPPPSSLGPYAPGPAQEDGHTGRALLAGGLLNSFSNRLLNTAPHTSSTNSHKRPNFHTRKNPALLEADLLNREVSSFSSLQNNGKSQAALLLEAMNAQSGGASSPEDDEEELEAEEEEIAVAEELLAEDLFNNQMAELGQPTEDILLILEEAQVAKQHHPHHSHYSHRPHYSHHPHHPYHPHHLNSHEKKKKGYSKTKDHETKGVMHVLYKEPSSSYKTEEITESDREVKRVGATGENYYHKQTEHADGSVAIAKVEKTSHSKPPSYYKKDSESHSVPHSSQDYGKKEKVEEIEVAVEGDSVKVEVEEASAQTASEEYKTVDAKVEETNAQTASDEYKTAEVEVEESIEQAPQEEKDVEIKVSTVEETSEQAEREEKYAEVEESTMDTETDVQKATSEEEYYPRSSETSQARAHEDDDIHPIPNHNTNPKDFIYPGVMVPTTANMPALPPTYYPPPAYSGGQHPQYPPTTPSVLRNPYYSSTHAYQPQHALPYASPYMPPHLGAYAYPTIRLPYQNYPGSSSSMSPYTSGSSNPPHRVARNSVVAVPVVRYVYGGPIFPQFG